jgi:hypothetical protein
MYLPDAPTFEAVRAAIRIKENYDHLCQKIRDFEARTDVRNYWMYSIAKQRIVGTLDAAGTPFKKKDQKALTIGYAVIRAQRGNGYARRAARLFTRSAAAMGIAYDFYADVIRSDYQRGPTKREKASAACLIKAGFREIPEGGSTPNGDADDVERQFALEFPTRGATATRPLRHARKIRAKQHTR